MLAASGIAAVGDPANATHILLNTCGFIQEAKEESIGAILDACAAYPDKQVVVMGCLVERYREELVQGIPEVGAWLGLQDSGGADGLLRLLGPVPGGVGVPRRRLVNADASFAYLKISDGCDELCTFCAIPGIKGPYHAASTAQILEEADACLSEGARELVLVGQDTARWQSGDQGLSALVDLLAPDPRLRWIRIMYLQPEHLTEAFLEHMAGQPKLCRYLDLPFQHSHPEVLRRMGRAGDGDSYLDVLGRARLTVPGVALRSAFIVGFPGETEAQFQHLLEFVAEAEFDYAGGFIYSPEEGTPAARLGPRVAHRLARERLNRLNQVLAETAERAHSRYVGSVAEVIVDAIGDDEVGDDTRAIGRTRGQAPEVDGVVYVESDLPEAAGVGDVITVSIGTAVGYDFIGTCVEP